MSTYQSTPINYRIDGITLVAALMIIFGFIVIYRDLHSTNELTSLNERFVGNHETTNKDQLQIADEEIGSGRQPVTEPDLDRIVSAPYDEYTLTQGVHGASYGHMAIDLSAGKGAIIKSPIQGYVSDLFTDQYGNPILVIENDLYRVTMLHGKYKVSIGDQIQLGQMLGRESNLGLTTDMLGNSCQGRPCGYHTHLNIFDKRLGRNVNPLDLLNKDLP
jgi:murein DD-endopeptidase MepM/ murein hydrolase activator NlpD